MPQFCADFARILSLAYKIKAIYDTMSSVNDFFLEKKNHRKASGKLIKEESNLKVVFFGMPVRSNHDQSKCQNSAFQICIDFYALT